MYTGIVFIGHRRVLVHSCRLSGDDCRGQRARKFGDQRAYFGYTVHSDGHGVHTGYVSVEQEER